MAEMKDQTAGARLLLFLDRKQLTETRAAELLDMRPAQLSRIIEGKNFRVHWLIRIHRIFPDINPNWLISGKGEMFVAEEIIPTEDEKEAIRLLDEARTLRNRVREMPAKRKAEISAQVIDTAERLMLDNTQRREKINSVREEFTTLLREVKKKEVALDEPQREKERWLGSLFGRKKG